MSASGWGNFPRIESDIYKHWSVNQVQTTINCSNEIIPSGLLRSYGDSALNCKMISTLSLNRILNFDKENKTITCESGISFMELINFLSKHRLTLPVTPGTKFITIGGAIASDVHGKNHHIKGSFGLWVESLRIILADGNIVNCSNTENSDLFRATVGGMGLTGLILDATIKLVELKSPIIEQTTVQAQDLQHLFELFEQYQQNVYTVSWLDTNSKSKKLGRGVLFVGKESSENKELILSKPKINVPFYFPSNTLNKLTVGILNNLYYLTNKNSISQVEFDKFFYPLDILDNWNRGYGRNGFIQYQFVVPKSSSFHVVAEVLRIMQVYGVSSFLTVLKLMGKQNEFDLSFPMEGYTLAMDLPVSKNTLKLADKLDELINANEGRIYLTKDARMKKEMFWSTNNNVNRFLETKAKYDPKNKFQSLQSKRLGIHV